jgi:uncharacterized protein YggE
MRTLSVRGSGHVSIKPDTIVFDFDIQQSHKQYDYCMKMHKERADAFLKEILVAGFKKEELKTTRHEVETERNYVNGNYIFAGYKASSAYRLEFDLNQSKIDLLVKTLAKYGSSVLYTIKYTIKDKEAATNLLLDEAVKDARKKASIMANAANVKLGNILNINYNWSEIHFNSELTYSDYSDRSMLLEESNVPDNPDDIRASDTVSVVWEII